MLHSGKNPKWLYFLRHYLQQMVPDAYYRSRLDGKLRQLDVRADRDYILDRVNYYNRLDTVTSLPDTVPLPAEMMKGVRQKVYRFDTLSCTRWFAAGSRFQLVPGDVTEVPDVPSLLKSRPIDRAGEGQPVDNRNSVVLKLNAVRHFIFVDDSIPFEAKKDRAVFRGKVSGKPLRQRFFRQYFGNPLCDLGDTSRHSTDPEEWRTGKMTIREHLQYKYILALEGNDVASNLKWVMSSNSIAVTPRMKYETWFMEGRLVPDYHYIEIKEDLSDLEEKLAYYSSHPEEAQQIIDHAHAYVRQFMDSRREELIQLLVTDKYFRMIGQR